MDKGRGSSAGRRSAAWARAARARGGGGGHPRAIPAGKQVDHGVRAAEGAGSGLAVKS